MLSRKNGQQHLVERTKKIFIEVCLLTFFLLCFISISGQTLNIVSWNLKDFGQSRDNEEIKLIAAELKDADIVAIQEVVAKHPGGAKAVSRLADELNRMGAKWDYRISDPTKSSSPYKSERYAYLWKSSKVKLSGGGPKLIEVLATIVEREPYFIQFKWNNETLSLLNYHACTHTKHYPERDEISAISKWLKSENFTNVIWVGDMNLVITDIAFTPLFSLGFKSALNGEKTSLKKECKSGEYLSRSEDNILYSFASFIYAGSKVIDFVERGNCREVSWKRDSYSDHLGVLISLGI